VNTHSEYRRHGYQPPESSAPQPEAEAEASELARHRDPSLTAATGTPAIAQKHVAWVRPTELASYAGPMVGRGIDLHTELVRGARRAPITTARAIHHPPPLTPPPPNRPVNRTEGLQL
jgi:hypothetical protein